MASPLAPQERPGTGRHLVSIAMLVATLALLFGPGLRDHVRFAADPWRFNDDARQWTWPLLRDANTDLFREDYIADYYLATLPRGYRLLYALGSAAVDPRALGEILPYAGLLVVLYSLVASTWRLAGPAAAWGTGALCLSGEVYLSRLSGGLPRSFAFPLVAMAVLALVRGCASLLAARKGARRLVPLIVAAFALYELSLVLWPRLFLPTRYLVYTLPLLTPVVLPAAIASLANRWRITRTPLVCAAVVVVAVASIVFFLGARDLPGTSSKAG